MFYSDSNSMSMFPNPQKTLLARMLFSPAELRSRLNILGNYS